nr:uncharacterized protein LOC109191859 [Ipomoea trifida]
MNACNNSLNCFSFDRKYVSFVTSECQNILKGLHQVSIKHIARIRNIRAHELTKSTILYRNSRYWRFEPRFVPLSSLLHNGIV